MYICYFLRIHPLCKPVVFKWVSWTSNISITWELVQSVNSGSTLNTLSSVFWPFQTLYFPCTLPCIFFSPSHPLPSCCDQWDLRGRFIMLLALLGRGHVRYSWRGALGVIILMEVLICHPQIKGKGHDLSACIDGTQWAAGRMLSSCYLSIWRGYWDLVI